VEVGVESYGCFPDLPIDVVETELLGSFSSALYPEWKLLGY
jgi:hypothetical protein